MNPLSSLLALVLLAAMAAGCAPGSDASYPRLSDIPQPPEDLPDETWYDNTVEDLRQASDGPSVAREGDKP
jgi:hypothetical protein